MRELANPTQTTYWIAYSDDRTVVHYGKTEPEQSTTTGQPNLDTFLDINLWKEQLMIFLDKTAEEIEELLSN